MVFWGEWEPESRVLRRYEPPCGGMPRFLYEPYFVRPMAPECRQNTDPFVFGDSFHYTGCRQHKKLHGTPRPTQLRHLLPGSVVLFGSCRDKSKFVLDTVFVVADHVDHKRADYESVLRGRISDAYRAVTIAPWYAANPPAIQSHRLYEGATQEQQVGQMFSFFPCQPCDGEPIGFRRPEISLPEHVNPRMAMGYKQARDLSIPDLKELWDDVVRQVQEQGLALGVRAELPRDETDVQHRITSVEGPALLPGPRDVERLAG